MNARAPRYRIAVVIGMSGLSLLGLAGVGGPAAATDPCTTPANAVVAENCLPGAPPSEWDVNGAGDLSIQGFATDISANAGDTVHFKVDTDAVAYTIDIYRMGYYGGDGARHIAAVVPSATLPQSQPACLTDAPTGLFDCGNWSESAAWAVPAQAASGIYIAKLTRTDTDGASHIPFVVRNDASHSDLLFETSDSTWQAYNSYGGNSLYVGGPGTNPGRAYKVSYNRPFTTRGGTAEDSFFNAEYPMVRWLEANGYDISYVSGVDTARAPVSMLEQHKVFMSVGHDEYWSGEQRAHVEAARDSGVHLAFFSGNQVFWKTRWEPSIDSTTTSYRTMVSYKETHAHAKIDPNPAWTGTWRDPLGAASDGGRPENALTGTIFTVNCCTYAIQVPASDGPLRLWRNTSVAGIEGGAATLAGSSLGYEWNEDLDNGSRPAGQIDLSSTSVSVPERIQDQGSTYGPGTATHSVTLHRASSGALVFDAGTVQWSWGLDGTHDRGGSTPDPAMRQATVNLFADMSVQPATLQSGLVAATASTDTAAPTSTVSSPGEGDTVLAGTPTTVSGAATDTGGGHVAGVEVSTDGGTTWHPATGHSSWSYTFSPQTSGTLTIRSRSTDDSVNTGPASAPVTVTVAPHQCPCSIWDASATPGTLGNNDGQSIDYGVKFRSDDAGTISGFRFYKSPGETGTHIGHLWSTNGDLLASATFTGETSSGWQQADLDTPFRIDAGTTYIGSIFSPSGVYPDNQAYFTGTGVDNPPLHALESGVDGPNAVYHQGADSFPDQTFNGSNYWADVVFSNGPDTTPPVITSRSPSSNATGVAVTRSVTANFDESLNASSVSSSTFELRDGSNALVPASVQYSAQSHSATLTPNSPLTSSSTYTARVTGGANGVTDAAGNALAADVSWSFTTAAPPADEGPGGPILVIATAGNPFGRYYGEILRAEGLDEFRVTDISSVTAGTLASYDVVVLGEMPLSAAQAAMLGNWVNSGGKLVAMRPDVQLAGLLGLSSAGSTRSNAYLRVDNTAPPGQGITNQTIQYHGTADNYNLAGASAVARLYSDAITATTFPAVTMHAVGANGGQAAAFSYDLARSVVYTREGNPAWSGQERDGFPPIRSDDLFFGGSASDPQPDWVDLDKVAIPQADEQQRLLANMVTRMEGPRMPLPRFWYLPRGKRAAIVMTGDDHATGGTAGRFDQELADSPPGCNVANWECVRSTSYVYPNSPLTDAQAAIYAAQGFEVALHVQTDCADWTPSSLANYYTDQLVDWHARYASQPGPHTMRTHCGAESDYSTQPHVELANGIRLDTTYYYWPPTWLLDRPGMFTGSGIPMRYADADGSAVDVYQATTQMTDESGQSYPFNVDTLLDNALGAPGYYGVFTANMHTDQVSSPGSDAIIASAQARGVPVVSAKQMLDWIDGRNASSFGAFSWGGDVLHFDVTQGFTANGLQAMLPATSADGAPLTSIARGASTVPFTTQTIKGVAYAFFDSPSGSYVATYTPDTTAPVISSVTASPNASGDATITWTTDEASDSSVAYGTDPDALDTHQSSGAIVTSHSITLHGLALGTTYRFRVSSADTSANAATRPAAPAVPASFTVPTVSATDTTDADFGAGAPGACAVVAHDSDGAVELGSAVNAEFSGSSLPGDWDTLLWDPNGSATVGGDQLVLDAARAGTTATYGSGRSLEFAATFAHETFEHVGFGIDFNDAPYAIFSTGNDGSTLKARSGDGNNATDTVLPGNLIGSPHRFRIDWTPSQILFSVDGVQVATHSATISQMRPLVSDFHHDGTNLTVDWLRMSPFTTSCAFVSRAFDAGAPSAWSTLDAATTTPNGTSVAIDTRTSDDGMSWSAWTPVNGTGITSPVGRYLEYRASLATTDDAVTPQLTSVHVAAVGMPDPPGIGTALGGNASVAVAFTAPADHGSPITGYTASCTSSDGGAPGTKTGTAGPISVTGLTNGKTYTCIVTATNAAGTSPPSAASNAAVPATAPGAPTIGTAVRGNTSIAVAFTAPANNGGSAVTGYTATCTSSDSGTPGTHTGTTSPITVGSLTNGKTYTCTVTAQNTAGTSAPSAASNAVIPATVPGAPTIGTAVRGNTSIAVAFTPPANNGGSVVTGYTGTCTSSDSGAPGTHTGTTSPITVGSLTNGKTYTCTVTATNVVGTGAQSAASNAVVPATVPGAPTIGTVTLTGTTASVPFTAPASNGGSATTGYTATCTSSNGGAPKSASQSTSPISVLALSPTKTYTCQAFATNAVGNGAASAASNVVTVANVPGAPTIGTAVRGNASISVPFTGPASNGGSAITGYTATCTSSNGGTTGVQARPTSPVSVGGLTNGKSYTCKVTAQNAVGTGAPSAASNAVVPATVPGAPTIGTATAAIGSASVAFTAPAGDGGSAITGYTATCTSSNGGATGTHAGVSSPVTVTGLAAAKSYTCTVAATNAVGTGVASAPSNTVIIPTVPAAPRNVTAVSGSTTATTGPLSVSFAAPLTNGGSPITGFTTTCVSSNGGVTGTQTGPLSPFTVTGLTTGRTYTCTVVATNAVGTGPASTPSPPVIVGSPASPTVVSVVTGSTTSPTGPLVVTFTSGADNGAAITGYTATCTSSNGGVSGTQSGAASPITVTGLTTAKTYACSVAATNSRGIGLGSAVSSALIVGAPAAPAGVKATAGSTVAATGPLTVTFTAGANNGAAITGYTATCTSSNGGVTGTQSGAASPITVTGLTTAKTYTCTVIATNARGTGLASAPPAPVIVGSPQAPTGVSAVKVASGQLRVTFTAGANNGAAITGYTATCTSSNGGVTGTQSGAASPITVTGLTTAKTYTCTVIATNARGTGLASAPSAGVVA